MDLKIEKDGRLSFFSLTKNSVPDESTVLLKIPSPRSVLPKKVEHKVIMLDEGRVGFAVDVWTSLKESKCHPARLGLDVNKIRGIANLDSNPDEMLELAASFIDRINQSSKLFGLACSGKNPDSPEAGLASMLSTQRVIASIFDTLQECYPSLAHLMTILANRVIRLQRQLDQLETQTKDLKLQLHAANEAKDKHRREYEYLIELKKAAKPERQPAKISTVKTAWTIIQPKPAPLPYNYLRKNSEISPKPMKPASEDSEESEESDASSASSRSQGLRNVPTLPTLPNLPTLLSSEPRPLPEAVKSFQPQMINPVSFAKQPLRSATAIFPLQRAQTNLEIPNQPEKHVAQPNRFEQRPVSKAVSTQTDSVSSQPRTPIGRSASDRVTEPARVATKTLPTEPVHTVHRSWTIDRQAQNELILSPKIKPHYDALIKESSYDLRAFSAESDTWEHVCDLLVVVAQDTKKTTSDHWSYLYDRLPSTFKALLNDKLLVTDSGKLLSKTDIVKTDPEPVIEEGQSLESLMKMVDSFHLRRALNEAVQSKISQNKVKTSEYVCHYCRKWYAT